MDKIIGVDWKGMNKVVREFRDKVKKIETLD